MKPAGVRQGLIVWTCFCFMTLPFAERAVAADLANLIPDNAFVAIEWTKFTDKSEILSVLRSILKSSFLADRKDDDLKPALDFYSFVEVAGAGTGVVAIVPGAAEVNRDPELLCVVDVGSDATGAAETFKRALQTDSQAKPPEPVDVRGIKFSRFGDGPGALFVGARGNLLFLTWGRHAAEMLTGPEPAKSLARNPEYVQDHNKIKAEGVWRVGVFVNITALAEMATNSGPGRDQSKKVVQALGLESFRSMFIQFDSEALGTRMSWYVHGQLKPEGLGRIWRQKPLTDADVALIPAEPYWASVSKLDLAELFQGGMSVGEKIDPSISATVNGAVAKLRGMLGFSLTEELLPAFGDSWVMFDAPDQGGVLFTGTVLVNNVRDATALQGMLQRIIEYLTPLAAQNKLTLVRKEMKSGSHTIQYLLVGGFPLPIAPAWTFVSNQWVFGLAPQTVAAALPQIDSAMRKKSLLDNPDYKAARAKLPKELVSLYYSDAKFGYRSIYPLLLLVRTAAASASANDPQAYDLSRVPTFPEELTALHNLVAGTSVDDEGALTTYMGASLSGLLVSGGQSAASLALMTSIMLPSLSRGRELAKRAVCASNMRGVAQGCWIYSNDHAEKFPKELKDLVEAGMCTPGQFICPSSDMTEVDVEEFLEGKSNRVGWTYIAGQSGNSNPQNVLLFETLSHHGEGANLVFVDGHVEFRRIEGVKAAVQETYKRLGREGEIPAELKNP